MTPAASGSSDADDPHRAFQARLSSVNAVFTLSLILTQATSPRQAMRLVTTAVPSIARCERALAWHPTSEALTNVVKHARASSAVVRVRLGDGRCVAEVSDDGIGGAWPRSEDGGLNGLRDRIGAINGTMQIASPVSGGTVLRADIPLAAQPDVPLLPAGRRPAAPLGHVSTVRHQHITISSPRRG